jgi:hypothetical protein
MQAKPYSSLMAVRTRYVAIFDVDARCSHKLRAQVANKSDAIKIACDFVSMQNLAVTERLVHSFRQHRLAVKWGDDLLALHSTLYYLYISLPKLREVALARDSQVPSGVAGDPSNSVTDATHAASSFDDSAMAVDDLPPQTSSKRDRKLMLRHTNEKNKRKVALSEERKQRGSRPGFDFICPLCPDEGFFNRMGVLLHLYGLHQPHL